MSLIKKKSLVFFDMFISRKRLVVCESISDSLSIVFEAFLENSLVYSLIVASRSVTHRDPFFILKLMLFESEEKLFSKIEMITQWLIRSEQRYVG
jgi:hypothetical protein